MPLRWAASQVATASFVVGDTPSITRAAALSLANTIAQAKNKKFLKGLWETDREAVDTLFNIALSSKANV